jgi:hypothetical protein
MLEYNIKSMTKTILSTAVAVLIIIVISLVITLINQENTIKNTRNNISSLASFVSSSNAIISSNLPIVPTSKTTVSSNLSSIVAVSSFSSQKSIDNNINGKIVGKLSYPSSSLIEVDACAENILTKVTKCIPRRNGNELDFEIEVPAGEYHVYSTSTFMKDYRAFDDESVQCAKGFPTIECSDKYPNPKPTIITVKSNTSVMAMPWNWYLKS